MLSVGTLCAFAVLAVGAIAGLWAADFRGFVGLPREAPSLDHLLGTDPLGRDLAARVARGAAISLFAGIASAVGVVGLGATLGMIAGLRRGPVDRSLVALANAVAAVPAIVGLLGIGLALGPGYWTIAVAIALTQWPGVFRSVRAETRRLDEATFVRAARAMGAGTWWIARRHLLPNLDHLIATTGAIYFAWAIKAEAVLGFLGLSPAGEPSWGRIIADGSSELAGGNWWPMLAAALPLFMVVLSSQLIADHLSERRDRPHKA
jgi:ABC-type dipeptide/oligopeptide/nickel transport system permease subunit